MVLAKNNVQSREKRRDATSTRSIRYCENARRILRHSIPSTDRVKSRWNRTTLNRARARKAQIYKKKNWERELVPKFSFGEDLHRRSSRGSRGADVRLGDDSGANKGGNCERHFYYLCCVCVYEVFSLRVWTLKRAFRKRLKNSSPLLRDEKVGCCLVSSFCVFLDGGGVVKKMPLGREEDRGPIAKNALGNLPSKKRTR